MTPLGNILKWNKWAGECVNMNPYKTSCESGRGKDSGLFNLKMGKRNW